MKAYRKSDAARGRAGRARTRDQTAELVYRNPWETGQVWQQMQVDRAAFVE